MTIVFGTIAVVSGLMVITEKNTVHSVFYLVMAFVNSAIILITYGMDYIGLLLIIVYVGAIAIIFIFVVMMINVKNEETNRIKYVPIGIIVTIILLVEVYMEYPKTIKVEQKIGYMINGGERNIEMMGGIMYT
jgi:NADH-quinone oxidoreductase subunit J